MEVNVVLGASRLRTHTRLEWQAIETEETSARYILLHYIAVVALLPAIASA